MQKRENPAGGPGLKKNTRCAGREDNTRLPLAAQGLSGCVPCTTCPYSRIVRFSKTKFRHQCGRDGQWLEACGVHECRPEEGGRHA